MTSSNNSSNGSGSIGNDNKSRHMNVKRTKLVKNENESGEKVCNDPLLNVGNGLESTSRSQVIGYVSWITVWPRNMSVFFMCNTLFVVPVLFSEVTIIMAAT